MKVAAKQKIVSQVTQALGQLLSLYPAQSYRVVAVDLPIVAIRQLTSLFYTTGHFPKEHAVSQILGGNAGQVTVRRKLDKLRQIFIDILGGHSGPSHGHTHSSSSLSSASALSTTASSSHSHQHGSTSSSHGQGRSARSDGGKAGAANAGRESGLSFIFVYSTLDRKADMFLCQ